MRRRIAALLFVAAAAGSVAGTVTTAKAEKTPSGRLQSSASTARPCPVPARYRQAFRAAARDTGLPVALLVAVARVESNLDHSALSSAGAQGLLQLMPETARELRLDASRPDSNVLAGARYLKRLLGRFRSTDLALAAYNAGPTAVERAGGAPTLGTLRYVADVTAHWHALSGCA